MSALVAGLIFLLSANVSESAPTTAPPSGMGEGFYSGLKKSDLVGPRSAEPDGRADASFVLHLQGNQGDGISEVEIRGKGEKPAIWSTANNPAAGFLGVALPKRPSEIINRRPGPLNLDSGSSKELLFFVSDDGNFDKGDREYEIRVATSSGNAFVIPVAGETTASQGSPQPGSYPFRMSAVLKGISKYDAVNPAKKIAGDDKADGLFVLTIDGKGKEITGLEISGTEGGKIGWDTFPGSRRGAIGVASAADPARLLNKRDSSINIKLDDQPLELNLYVADDGSIADGKTNFKLRVLFGDGSVSWCDVQPAPEPVQKAPVKVNFLATWVGVGQYDSVGQYHGMKPDGVADTVFGLDIEVRPKSIITKIELESTDSSKRKWSTGAVSGQWGLGAAFQATPDALLNKADGSIHIPIDGRFQLFLYAADPGNISSTYQNLKMIVHLDDGSAFQQMVRKPLGSTSTVVPGVDEQPQARGLISCEFLGFIADLVNTSTRPGKDGYMDGTFIMKLQVEDKKLAKVEISGDDGTVRWSSDPKAPVMFLGVAVYPGIFKLINEKGGLLQTPITGRRTLYLYAADNGMLSNPKIRLNATVTFTDKSTLTGEVAK